MGIFLINSSDVKKEMKYSSIMGYFEDNQVKEFEIDLGNGNVVLELKETAVVDEEFISQKQTSSFLPWLNNDSQEPLDPQNKGITLKYTVPNTAIFLEDIRPIIKEHNLNNPTSKIIYNYKKASELPWLLNILPTIILIVAVIVLYIFMIRRMSGVEGGSKTMNFGKAKFKQVADEKRKTTFADVAGADEEKEELREVVDFLKNQKKFNELGARIPKGLLLVGPPGTGKTLLARAVAGEAGVPFFSISGSDFVEMFVGVGASRVRDLFEQAKKNSPCIIFIDEIDAVGRHRGAGLGGGHDEREQTLNQLLVEMDGFGANEGVIMIAATNRPDILDPALMRPGRFDRQIMVGYPDIKGREEILKVHSKGKPLAPDVNLATIAKSTSGFTGADLENLLNEAALLSARKSLKSVTMEEIEEATVKVVVGAEKRSRVVTDKDKKITSYHEAGHAVVTYFLATQDPVHQISIIPRGMAGGYTMYLPVEDKAHKTKQEMKEEIIGLLGGRVAEKIVLEDISTGASNDIERATKIAYSMVTKYGMSDELGPIAYSAGEEEVFLGRDIGHKRDFSERTASKIDDEVYGLVSSGYKQCEAILRKQISKLHDVAKYLFENEKMDGKQFADMMEEKSVESYV